MKSGRRSVPASANNPPVLFREWAAKPARSFSSESASAGGKVTMASSSPAPRILAGRPPPDDFLYVHSGHLPVRHRRTSLNGVQQWSTFRLPGWVKDPVNQGSMTLSIFGFYRVKDPGHLRVEHVFGRRREFAEVPCGEHHGHHSCLRGQPGTQTINHGTRLASKHSRRRDRNLVAVSGKYGVPASTLRVPTRCFNLVSCHFEGQEIVQVISRATPMTLQ